MHDMPGTTRDAIDTVVETDDGPLRFVDTAGLRRKSRIDEPTEYYSLVRALEAIDRADAALFLIDATEGVTHQDQRLAERVDAAGTAIVIVLNKWDLLDTEERGRGQAPGRRQARVPRYAPVLPISALTGRRVHHLLPALREAEAAYHQRIPTAALNRVLRDAQAAHPPPIAEEAPAADPLRDAGRDRPADVHAVHDPALPPHVPALPRAQAAGVVRPRPDADQDPRPAPATSERERPRNIACRCPIGRRASRSVRSVRATGCRTRRRCRSTTGSG